MKAYLSTGKSANGFHFVAGLCCYIDEPSLRLCPPSQKLLGAAFLFRLDTPLLSLYLPPAFQCLSFSA
ncbi:protein of unknown function [Pseudomonas sp. JV551A1]|nr:protein of unknown function [Pseudomonas sp. JV551A1]